MASVLPASLRRMRCSLVNFRAYGRQKLTLRIVAIRGKIWSKDTDDSPSCVESGWMSEGWIAGDRFPLTGTQ
jgi:hypothetical protein